MDARRILRPLSHDKYIKEPAPGVVYVSRRVSKLLILHTDGMSWVVMDIY